MPRPGPLRQLDAKALRKRDHGRPKLRVPLNALAKVEHVSALVAAKAVPTPPVRVDRIGVDRKRGAILPAVYRADAAKALCALKEVGKLRGVVLDSDHSLNSGHRPLEHTKRRVEGVWCLSVVSSVRFAHPLKYLRIVLGPAPKRLPKQGAGSIS